MLKFTFKKLVRDKVVTMLKEKNIDVQCSHLDSIKYQHALIDKLHEETAELSVARKKEDILNELVDLQEIIDALLELHKINKKEFNSAQLKKYNTSGGFKERAWVNYIQMHEDNPSRAYYENQSNKYKRVV